MLDGDEATLKEKDNNHQYPTWRQILVKNILNVRIRRLKTYLFHENIATKGGWLGEVTRPRRSFSLREIIKNGKANVCMQLEKYGECV